MEQFPDAEKVTVEVAVASPLRFRVPGKLWFGMVANEIV
jgi:hypothetical protein